GGAYNFAGIAAMGAAVRLLLDAGIDRVAERVRELTDHLCEESKRAGAEVFSSRLPGEWSGIVSLTVPGRDPRELVRRCRAAAVAGNHRAGRVRVSPHCYNSFDEIDRFVECLREPS